MSDQPLASNEPTGEPVNQVGDTSGTDRAVALAKTALNSRLADRQKQQADKAAKEAETIASVKALLLNTWSILGIDPDTVTTNDRGRPIWKGSITLTDPNDPKAQLNRVTLETSVMLHDDGLYFRAGSGSTTVYAKRNAGTLPEAPPADSTIGNMVLNGWIGALQEKERERKNQLDSLFSYAQEIVNGYNRATEENLHRLAVRVAALKPGDLPDPYEESLAAVTAKLAKASQCVEAKLQASADYTAAATRVKLTAAKWMRRYAAWDDECNSLARILTEHHFRPFIVYKIRYTAIGAPPAIVDEDGNIAMAAEEIHTLQSPLEIANEGRAIMVSVIDYNGNPSVVVIGAFLDAAPSSMPKHRLPPPQAHASITRAGSAKATTTPTSPRP